MKKLLALLLALMMVIGASAIAEEEKVTLTAFQYSLENQNVDFNNLWYFQKIEEETGVHVDFRVIKDADWDTQLNLMFASDELTDMILGNSADVEEYGVTQKLLLPLDEYLTPEIMPNYVSRLPLNNAGDSIPASDGKTYYIGYLVAQNVNHEPTWYINMPLLEELSLDVPTTIDEYTDVLRAFKEAGIKYPYSASCSDHGAEHIWAQFSSFGVPLNMYMFAFIQEDDTVGFVGDQPGFRDCCEWLNLLYTEGLMDPESLTQDSNLWANKVNAGEVASFNYLRLINTALTTDTIQNFDSMLPPAADGYKVTVPSILENPKPGAMLTRDCKDPVAALKWLDAQLETENMMIAANGKMGEQMIINAEGKYEIINVPENNGLYDIVPVTMGQFFAPGEYYSAIYQMAPHRVERYEDSIAYAEADVLEYKSFHYLRDLCKLSNEDAIEVNNIFTELKKLIQETVIEFAKNGVTDESYNAFLEAANGIGVERYIEIYQEAYEDFLAK
ncbi:MAG: extracellular solute-binding protein [Clostridia bacterium]|nr:extracellular solute-binding protein [Clostridia bacterium]